MNYLQEPIRVEDTFVFEGKEYTRITLRAKGNGGLDEYKLRGAMKLCLRYEGIEKQTLVHEAILDDPPAYQGLCEGMARGVQKYIQLWKEAGELRNGIDERAQHPG